jgi:hypothetical protein
MPENHHILGVNPSASARAEDRAGALITQRRHP